MFDQDASLSDKACFVRIKSLYCVIDNLIFVCGKTKYIPNMSQLIEIHIHFST